jgi:hypothetical protein
MSGLTLSTPQSGIKTVPTRERGNEVSYLRPTAAGGFASIAMTQMTQERWSPPRSLVVWHRTGRQRNGLGIMSGLTLSTPQSGIKTVPTRERGNEVSYLRPTAAGGFASIAMTRMTQMTQEC